MFRELSWSFRFAFSELRSEWLFGLGVALAVCSVVTPTALLWGTKTGMIDTMRGRLLKEPAIRELVGEENTALPKAWFEKMRANPKVSFVIPSVRHISLYGDIYTLGATGKPVEDVAFLPTATGDPIGGGVDIGIDFNGAAVPCMVVNRIAEELGVKSGGRIVVSVSRIEDGTPVKASFECVIQRVLEPHESNIKAVFLPLEAIERIEDYKDGRAVSVFGWNKNLRESLRVYDSFRLRLRNKENTSSAIKILSETKDVQVIGDIEKGEIRVFSTNDGIDHATMLRLTSPLSQFEPRILLEAEAQIADRTNGGDLQLKGKILAGDDSNWISLREAEDLESTKTLESRPRVITTVALDTGTNQLSLLRLSIPHPHPSQRVLRMPPEMVGVIGAAKRRPMEFTQTNGEFRPIRDQYPGFRLYARELEDVKPLRLECTRQGIQVRTNEDRIQGVLDLDSAFGKFLTFIVVGGGLGGVGALFTSLYLSIERSRRQFAVLQILGIPLLHIFIATLLQAVLVVLAGVVASFAFFQIGAWLLTAILAPENGSGEHLCELQAGQWGVLVGASVFCSCVSTLLALGRLRFRDPALVARSE